MSTQDALRRAALALPEAYEDLHRRRPAFRVRGKIFATLSVAGNRSLFERLGDERPMAVLKFDRDDQLNMIAAFPEALSPVESYAHHGYTYVDVGAIDDAALETLVRLAWSHVAPKRLSRA